MMRKVNNWNQFLNEKTNDKFDISTKLYRYEIGVYRNNPRTQQIGGGYGTSGIMSIENTNLLGSIDNYCRNKNVISSACLDVKKYSIENF